MGEEEAFFFLSVLFLVSHKPPVPLQSALSRHHSLTSASWRMFSNWIVKARTKPNVLNSISIQNQIWIGVNLLPSFIFLLPMPSTAVPYTSANKVCLHTQCLCWLTSWFGRGFEKALTNRCQLTRLQCQGLVLFIATSLIPLAPFPRVTPWLWAPSRCNRTPAAFNSEGPKNGLLLTAYVAVKTYFTQKETFWFMLTKVCVISLVHWLYVRLCTEGNMWLWKILE